ncbi:MAG TPA: hypothetical protein VFL91_01305 [Thermomicrobiales bacterium]|nr:hypothetical protein [Thermomicrobiales bacterium]
MQRSAGGAGDAEEAQLEAGCAHRTEGCPLWAHLSLAERRRHVEEARAELGYPN